MDRRYKVVNMLATRGFVKNFQGVQAGHRWDSQVAVEANASDIRRVLEAAEAELERRQEPPPAPAVEPKQEPAPAPVEAAPQEPAHTETINSPQIKIDGAVHNSSIVIGASNHGGKKSSGLIVTIGLGVAIIGALGTWLTVPEFHDWVQRQLGFAVGTGTEHPPKQGTPPPQLTAPAPQRPKPTEPRNSLRRRTVRLANDLAEFLAERNAKRPTDPARFQQFDQETINLYLARYRERTLGILQELKAKGLDVGILDAPGAAPSRYLMPNEIEHLRDLAFHLDADDKVVQF